MPGLASLSYVARLREHRFSVSLACVSLNRKRNLLTGLQHFPEPSINKPECLLLLLPSHARDGGPGFVREAQISNASPPYPDFAIEELGNLK